MSSIELAKHTPMIFFDFIVDKSILFDVRITKAVIIPHEEESLRLFVGQSLPPQSQCVSTGASASLCWISWISGAVMIAWKGMFDVFFFLSAYHADNCLISNCNVITEFGNRQILLM